MRLLMLLLVFLAGYTAAGGAQETDDAASIEIGLNPLDYVPLEVGNRWTYSHHYINHTMMHWPEEPFAITGYPPGIPLDSLRLAEKIVTIEITHTEVIDGLEYFVFSDADYAWPPLPGFFWGGKKVRLSDEGFLVFRWNGQDIPVYDFGHTSSPCEYRRTLPIESGTAEVRFNRFYAPYQLSRVSFVLNSYSLSSDNAGIIFLQKYGVGQSYIEFLYCGSVVFRNELAPISATISGEEIVYQQERSSYQSFGSTGLGQVAQVRRNEGFDFSEGKHSEPSDDFEVRIDRINLFGRFPFAGKPACFGRSWPEPFLFSKTGIDHLGKIDFDFLTSKGIPPDLRLDFDTKVGIYEGHTYAVRSREGGDALLYVFDVEFHRKDYQAITFENQSIYVRNIKFDWVYYPDGLLDGDTSVQPTSWGQLKQLFLQDSPVRPED